MSNSKKLTTTATGNRITTLPIKYSINFLSKPDTTFAIKKMAHFYSIPFSSSIEKEKIEETENLIETNTIKNYRIVLKFQEALQIIRFKDLVYCKSQSGYTTFYLADGRKFVGSKPLKAYEKVLIDTHFVRTHQSYIININFVDKYEKQGFIHLTGNIKIPVASRKKEQVLHRLF